MKQNISLRLRVTLVCGILLAVCCLLLTISHNYYATKMADSIAATPLQPAQTVGETVKDTTDAVTLSQIALPARKTFRTQSMIAMGVIVTMGCLSVYWLTGKALAPLHQLDEQIRRRTAADLDQPLPVPSSADEVAGLTISFNQMSHNLSKAFAQQKRFSQCAAHELRTPLTILKTRMALFRKKGLCSTPETAELLNVLEEQTNRLSHLVQDLLSLTNMDSLAVNEEVSIPKLLNQTADSLTELAKERSITLQVETAPGTIPGNSILLERALSNLIENAIQYSKPDTTVSIRAIWEPGLLWLEVSDEGIGIPQEFLEQIFEPFFRVDKSRSRQFGGAGLGLSLVRAIAELHQGRITASSTQGRGTCFVMTLPRERKSP